MLRSLALSALSMAFATALLSAGGSSEAGDWLRFRGSGGAGVSEDTASTPTEWSPTSNVLWKTDLPGSGVSSPIIVGEKVFVTCYSGYGLNRNNPGNIEDLKRHLVCVNKETGAELWTKVVDAVLPEDPYTGIGVTAHGYASHTPVSDGERVYVFYGKSGVLAYDLEGNELWRKSVGTGSDRRAWGSSSSPVLYDGKVIVTAAAESESIVALDAKTGEEVWKQESGGLDSMWGTPILVEIGEDRTELVLSVPGELWGMNPDTGKLRWYAIASQADQAHTSAITSKGMVYAVTGRGGAATAVMLGGKGDVTDSHVVWSGRETSRFGTPIVYEDRIYLIANGIVRTLDAATGEQLSQSRLPSAGGGGGQRGGGGGRGRGGFGGSLDYASPVIADGKLYYLNGKGQMFVYGIGEKLEELAVNTVTEDSEAFGGTPAVSDGRIFLRSSKRLYCVGAE